jgi:negative regulator of sigma-B (phosphoserine phosphatase)
VDRHIATDARPLIDWAVAQAAMTGELRSGDVHVFQEFPSGVLVAVVDEEAVESLARPCHQTLRGTRGAAMSLASFDWRTQTVTCLAVGNVEASWCGRDRGRSPGRASA